MAKIIIPTPLRKFTDNKATIEVEAIDIRESINALSELYPDYHQLDQDHRYPVVWRSPYVSNLPGYVARIVVVK